MKQIEIVPECCLCPSLCAGRHRIVWGQGSVPAPVLFVAEAPGEWEDQYGYPFVEKAKAGEEYTALLLANHLDRYSGVYTTNAVKCHPPGNRDPLPSEQAACWPYLCAEIDAVDPHVIATVGRISTRLFLGDVNMENVHGIPYIIGPDHGSHLPLHLHGRIVVPVVHPAAGLHKPADMLLVQSDFRAVADVLRRLRPPYHVTDEWEGLETYLEAVTPADVQSALCGTIIAIDTETTRSGPWCLSFSTMDGVSHVIMAGNDPCLAALNAFVSGAGVLTIIHNAPFDLPILAKMGVYPARFRDTMSMAYLLQSEPQGLKPLSYRHLGMIMHSYGDMVAEADRANAISYLEMASIMEWEDPDPVEVWAKDRTRPDGTLVPAHWHTKQPQNIGKKIRAILRDAETKGVDPRKRWEGIGLDEGRWKTERVIGPMPPGELCDIDRGDAVHYSSRDADATLRLYPKLLSPVLSYGLEGALDADMACMPMVVDMMEWGMRIDPTHFRDLSHYLQSRMEEEEKAVCAIAGKRVNPASTPDMRWLLFDKLRLPSYKKTGGGDKSTDEKVLSRLADHHPVVQHIRDYRSYHKLKTSYADVLPMLADDGMRVHTNLRITRVETGRLSSSDPNLMAQPVRTSEGRRMRDGFVAEDGYIMLSADYSQIEMRTCAHDSQDPELLRIFRLGLDIHSETASWMFGIPIPELDEMLHRYPAKRVGFGVLNDLSAKGLQRELIAGGAPEAMWPLRRCQDLIDSWFIKYSGVKAWMRESHAHAMRYGWVADMWGRLRFIPGARSPNKWTKMEALRQAGNAPIQMGAQGVIKRAMAALTPWYKSHNGAVRPLIQIHDDLVFEIREDVVDEAKAIIPALMEGAVKLSVPIRVDMKMGKRWGSMEKVRRQ